MTFEDFQSYQEIHEKRIFDAYHHMQGTTIISVYDFEKTSSSGDYLFTAEFSNGEALSLLRDSIPSSIPTNRVNIERLMYSSSEDLILLSVGFSGLYIVADKFRKDSI